MAFELLLHPQQKNLQITEILDSGRRKVFVVVRKALKVRDEMKIYCILAFKEFKVRTAARKNEENIFMMKIF